MGADGGTIPKRCELVKKKKKVEKLDKHVKNATKWKNCQLTQLSLKKPIIACRLGKLYNKEDVINAILNKTIAKSIAAAHIKGTKDFVELKLHDNKDYSGDNVKGDEYNDVNQTQYLCPVTGVPMNGNHNFIVNWKCGCVFSEKAMNEVKSDRCHGCSGDWNILQSVQLNPNEETLELYKNKLETERLEKKAAKKAKATAEAEAAAVEGSSGSTEAKKEIKGDKKKTVGGDVLARKAEKRKTAVDIQSDPTKSKTYKNMFTTCEAAKNKVEGPWVTYNPLYY